MTTPLELAFRAASNLKHENTMKEAAQRVITLTEKNKARFWAKVNKDGPLPDQSNPHYNGLGQCWIWTASLDSHGYGHAQAGGTIRLAHRVAWVLANGQIPHGNSYHGTCVCHRCDNSACVNPSHLFLGTHTDNVRDRESKDRGARFFGDQNASRKFPEKRPRGERHKCAKLTAEQVIEIRAIYAKGGLSKVDIAAQFGVHNTTICKIISREKWKHL